MFLFFGWIPRSVFCIKHQICNVNVKAAAGQEKRMELECLCRGLHHLASMSRTVQSMVCHQQQQAVQIDRRARKYTFQQDVEKYEMTFEFQGEMPLPSLYSELTMVWSQ